MIDACIGLMILPLLVGTITDLRERILKNSISFSILFLGLIRIYLGYIPLWESVIGTISCFFPMIVLAVLDKNSLGGGDIKICTAVSITLGFGGLFIVATAFFISFLYGKFTKDTFLPLAPFLTISYLIYLGGLFYV